MSNLQLLQGQIVWSEVGYYAFAVISFLSTIAAIGMIWLAVKQSHNEGSHNEGSHNEGSHNE